MTTAMRITLAALLAMTWSAASVAQMIGGPDSGWYVGGALGQAEFRKSCEGLPPGVSCDEKDTAFRLLGGYQFSRNFSAELAFTRFGETTASDGVIDVKIESQAWELVAIGAYPFPEGFTLYGKLGLYRARTEGTSNVIPAETKTNSDLTAGFGGRYDFNRNFGLRLEWQRYVDVGGETFGDSEIDLISLGAIWKF